MWHSIRRRCGSTAHADLLCGRIIQRMHRLGLTRALMSCWCHVGVLNCRAIKHNKDAYAHIKVKKTPENKLKKRNKSSKGSVVWLPHSNFNRLVPLCSLNLTCYLQADITEGCVQLPPALIYSDRKHLDWATSVNNSIISAACLLFFTEVFRLNAMWP